MEVTESGMNTDVTSLHPWYAPSASIVTVSGIAMLPTTSAECMHAECTGDRFTSSSTILFMLYHIALSIAVSVSQDREYNFAGVPALCP
eukprot:m.1074926 g.1074926  ORF g.1074926 m.1074926 type:complete len:89 (+) comp24238_c0_seq69:5174-5440(+)